MLIVNGRTLRQWYIYDTLQEFGIHVDNYNNEMLEALYAAGENFATATNTTTKRAIDILISTIRFINGIQ